MFMYFFRQIYKGNSGYDVFNKWVWMDGWIDRDGDIYVKEVKKKMKRIRKKKIKAEGKVK